MQDLRHSFRRLIRTPGFSALAIATLALGIGASTAIFSIVEGVLLRPLDYRAPGQLVWLRETTPSFGQAPLPINASHFLTWRERATSFAALSVLDHGSAALTGSDRPEQLALAGVSANFFELLGVSPALGRSFFTEEETAGRNRVLVISDALWRRVFAADPAIVGRTISLDHEPHTIVGVLPARFQHPHVTARGIGSVGAPNPDLFRPKVFSAEELKERFGRHNYGTIGRLKPAVTVEAAEAELNEIGAQIVREIGMNNTILRALVLPLHEAVVGQSRTGLLVLFAAVTSVLLIACVNLTNFLFAQAERRRQESAVRQALGASRGRLVRQALTDTLLVAGIGGVLGIGLAWAGLGLLLRVAPGDLPRLDEVRLDGGVLGFAIGLSLFTGLLFGVAPAWRLARTDPQQALAAGSRALAGGGGRRLSSVLVAAEVALSLVLLTTAALLAGSFARLLQTDKGFHAPNVLSAEVAIPVAKYREPAQRIAFFEQVVERLGSMPGVRSATMINSLPLQGETWVDKAAVAGDPRPLAEKTDTNVRFITGAYFEMLDIPLRAGRTFAPADRQKKVTIISETLAERLWPGENPIGRRLERWAGDEFEVIGVAGDVRPAPHRAPVPTMYRGYWDWPPRRMLVVVRTVGDPRAAAGMIRAAVRDIDADVPVPVLRTMDDVLSASVAQQRFQVMLAATFAGAALLLTALGIYGVVAYSVTRRRKEFGIRMAFGAAPAAVQCLLLRQSLAPVLAGLVGGIAAALAVARVLQSLLYETRATDPLVLATVSLALVVVAAVACYLPGRQSTRIDPVESLRAE